MKELKQIIQINKHDDREKALMTLAQKLGVSTTRCANPNTGRVEEDIIIDRIYQAYALQYANRSWIIALISSVASVISAAAAWSVIFIGR